MPGHVLAWSGLASVTVVRFRSEPSELLPLSVVSVRGRGGARGRACNSRRVDRNAPRTVIECVKRRAANAFLYIKLKL